MSSTAKRIICLLGALTGTTLIIASIAYLLGTPQPSDTWAQMASAITIVLFAPIPTVALYDGAFHRERREESVAQRYSLRGRDGGHVAD